MVACDRWRLGGSFGAYSSSWVIELMEFAVFGMISKMDGSMNFESG